jgi:hypothetical protein
MLPLLAKKTWMKYAVVPFVLFSVYASFDINEEFIGRARYEEPNKRFLFKSYSLTEINGKRYITMWVEDQFDDRLIRFEWTKERQKKMEDTKKKSDKGIPQVGEFAEKSAKKGLDTSRQELVFYDFPVQKIFPKNAK